MNYLNDINENENDIRPPDNVIREQLIPSVKNIYDEEIEELEKALQISIQENLAQQELYNSYEKFVMEEYEMEKKARIDKFKDLLFDLNKLSKYDKEIKNIFEIIEPIIDSYCNQIFEFQQLDKNLYENIFLYLSKIRTNKKNIENLKSILIIN
jgi:hypothetical protein